MPKFRCSAVADRKACRFAAVSFTNLLHYKLSISYLLSLIARGPEVSALLTLS